LRQPEEAGDDPFVRARQPGRCRFWRNLPEPDLRL